MTLDDETGLHELTPAGARFAATQTTSARGQSGNLMVTTPSESASPPDRQTAQSEHSTGSL
ncbi:MAG TPA: hypothetical protein VIJ96_12145 [Acidothermaceae bacterium]